MFYFWRRTATVCFWFVIAGVSITQAAPSEPETYSRLSFSVGGYYYSGNLNQVQGNFQGHYGLSSPSNGLDVLFNGYRLWAKSSQNGAYKVSNDDAFVTMLPFWYVTDSIYIAGLGRYESSSGQRLNARYIGGAGLGYTPIRSKLFLVRMSFMPAFEYAEFDGEDFRIDVRHDGPNRRVLRATMMSNGWYRVQQTPITFRYFVQLWPNPQQMNDFRANLTSNMDIKITEPLAFRLSVNLNHDGAILSGREPTDVRSTFGFVLRTL